MYSYKKLPYMILITFLLLSALFGFRAAENPSFDQHHETGSNGIPVENRFESDPVVQFIGKNFDDIKQKLGEPHEHGSSNWLGPHDYILYHFEDGYIRFGSSSFGSSNSEKNSIATSIIIGPGQEVLGVRAGMAFSEIVAILGEPDFGPEPGINNQYHMGYYWGEVNDQIPEYTISFVADDIDAPTRDVFIKWEGSKYCSSSFH